MSYGVQMRDITVINYHGVIRAAMLSVGVGKGVDSKCTPIKPAFKPTLLQPNGERF